MPLNTSACAFKRSFSCADQEGGQGIRTPPLKDHKVIEFVSNTGLDPLKITKLLSQHSILGYHPPASETSFKLSLAGRPMMARSVVFRSTFPSTTKKSKKKIQKQNCQSWTPSDQTSSLNPCMLLCVYAICTKISS